MNESLRIFYIDIVPSNSNLLEKFNHPKKCMIEVFGEDITGGQIKVNGPSACGTKTTFLDKCCSSGSFFYDKSPRVCLRIYISYHRLAHSDKGK